MSKNRRLSWASTPLSLTEVQGEIHRKITDKFPLLFLPQLRWRGFEIRTGLILIITLP
jgi:hypothetical protein